MKSKSVMSRVYTCASRSRHIFRRVVVSVWIGILSLLNSSFTRGLVICPRLDAWSCLLRFRRCLERRSPRYDHWFHGGLEPLASYKDSWFPVRHVFCIILYYTALYCIHLFVQFELPGYAVSARAKAGSTWRVKHLGRPHSPTGTYRTYTLGTMVVAEIPVFWLCAWLRFQIEHHLFPQLPRHNLSKAQIVMDAADAFLEDN